MQILFLCDVPSLVAGFIILTFEMLQTCKMIAVVHFEAEPLTFVLDAQRSFI